MKTLLLMIFIGLQTSFASDIEYISGNYNDKKDELSYSGEFAEYIWKTAVSSNEAVIEKLEKNGFKGVSLWYKNWECHKITADWENYLQLSAFKLLTNVEGDINCTTKVFID